jgi:hypothetical protein
VKLNPGTEDKATPVDTPDSHAHFGSNSLPSIINRHSTYARFTVLETWHSGSLLDFASGEAARVTGSSAT